MNFLCKMIALVVALASNEAESIQDKSKAGVNYGDVDAFISQHNHWRSIVSPNATAMLYMSWDSDLAGLAQKLVNKCEFKHDTSGAGSTNFKSYGQNLWAGTGGYNIKDCVAKWDSEKANYTLSTNKCDTGAVCGHYTQVVWAKSYKVGCGIKFCSTIPGFAANAYMIACNYGPAGNVVGQAPYVEGSVCNCTTPHPNCQTSLCRMNPVCGGSSCENNATFNEKTCQCECTPGFSGKTCETSGATWCTSAFGLIFTCFVLYIAVNSIEQSRH